MTKRKQPANPWKQAWDDGDIILILLAIISLIITELGSCLTSQTSVSSTQVPGKQDLQSNGTTQVLSGKAKCQARSRSTKPTDGTVDQKKVVGGTTKAGPSRRSASSPRSKRSRTTSSTQKNTTSGTSRTLGFQPRTQAMTLTSAPTTQSPILSAVPPTADASNPGTSADNQSA